LFRSKFTVEPGESEEELLVTMIGFASGTGNGLRVEVATGALV
jgi:hypothetical protein